MTDRVATARERAAIALANAEAAEARARRDVANHKRRTLAAYRAADRGRLSRDFTGPKLSADQAILDDLPTLYGRARQMTRDDSYGASIVRAFQRNVIGRGMTPVPSKRFPDGRLDERYNDTVARLWRSWSTDPDLVDVEGKRSWSQIERWGVGELVVVGDAFLQVIVEPATDEFVPSIRVLCIEAEQLTDHAIQQNKDNGNAIVGGVEVDARGRPVAYWIDPSAYDRLPHKWRRRATRDGKDGEPVRVDAADMLHLVDPERAHQTRGVGRIVPALPRLWNLHRYNEAMLVKARAEACLGMVIKSDGAAQGLADIDGQTGDDAVDDELAMMPLSVVRLAPNEDVTPFTPTTPNGAYDGFVVTNLRAAAAGCGISYEQIARDFTSGSYSSQRQAILEDKREWRILQDLIVAQWERPFYRRFLSAAVAHQKLKATGYSRPATRRDYWSVEFAPDGHDWIDPEKEAKAAALMIEQGLETKTRILADRGVDFRELTAQRAAEMELEADLIGEEEPEPEEPEVEAEPAEEPAEDDEQTEEAATDD